VPAKAIWGGSHIEICEGCEATRIAYNSCRNRHCPKCQGSARATWLAARQAELLPVPYFHIVFTLPQPIAAIAYQNKKIIYAILFRAAAEAMTTLAANPRRLGAGIGGVSVLHTWGQALTHHPHLHCVVPGGGIASDKSRWIPTRSGFFLPVKPLVSDPAIYAAQLRAMRRIDWVVYAKKPFGGPAQVLAYLGRYTHRVAIANSRLVAIDDTSVAFTWKDYRDGSATKVMRLKPHEFIRRFLLHALPDGFHRIRYFGFMANGHRAARLTLCRSLLNAVSPETAKDADADIAASFIPACPHCGGLMRIAGLVPRPSRRPEPRAPPSGRAAA